MSANTTIEWTDATWNPLAAIRNYTGKRGWHCEKISPACDNCYAASMNKRSDGLVGIGTGLNYAPDSLPKVRIEIDEKTLLAPLKWRKPRKIFVCSMTDLFGEFVSDEIIDRVFAVMALCPQHTFQVLTKRPERMQKYLTGDLPLSSRLDYVASQAAHTGKIVWDPRGSSRVNYYGCGLIGDVSNRRVFPGWPLPNVWLGVTAENQEWADKRIPVLLDTPAAKRFVSIEPMLGPVRLDGYVWPMCAFWSAEYRSYEEAKAAGARCGYRRQALVSADTRFLDWVIAGGESGRGARPARPEWLRALRDQCEKSGVPFLFKQWGEWGPFGQGGAGMENGLVKVGKKKAGRMLDGVEWSQFPEVSA